MAEQFLAAEYGGNWWTSPRTAFNNSSCSSVVADNENFGHFCARDLMYMKSKSSDESSDDSMVSTTISPDYAFQMMATSFSNSSIDTTTDWNLNLLSEHDGLNIFSTCSDDGSMVVTEADHEGFTMDYQQSLNLANNYPASLRQSYFNSNSPSQKQPLYDFQSNSNNFNSTQPSPSAVPKQVHTNLKLTDNTAFWNALTSPSNDNISSIFSSPSSQSYRDKRPLPNFNNMKPNHQESVDSGSTAKKGSSTEEQFKRPRLETPSPLPTFKVRKEKLGDRITALQQLVSPFGKTDTASVLHEAIEYIKLLHDQVDILRAPYMRNGATRQLQQIHNKVKDVEGDAHDLRSLGLCLVPVSSTFPVANEMANGFWAPSFEGSFS